jgi:hypothetical protein
MDDPVSILPDPVSRLVPTIFPEASQTSYRSASYPGIRADERRGSVLLQRSLLPDAYSSPTSPFASVLIR